MKICGAYFYVVIPSKYFVGSVSDAYTTAHLYVSTCFACVKTSIFVHFSFHNNTSKLYFSDKLLKPLHWTSRYILFDGDVDALWVENMNSVMDDNKLLTLANGERIRLQNHCALLFEVCLYLHVSVSRIPYLYTINRSNKNLPLQVGDLQYASPATVSRCGMVFVDPKNLRYTPYWQRWVASRPEKVFRMIYSVFIVFF